MRSFSDYSRRTKRYFIRGVVCSLAVTTWLILWPRYFLSSQFSPQVQHTLVIYSGPTSLDKEDGKTFMYLKNFDYFLEHGVSCGSAHVDVHYIFVLTQDVANHYSSPHGLITKKKQNCKHGFDFDKARAQDGAPSYYESSIEIIIRENRCFDMESLRIVTEKKGIQRMRIEYNTVVFLNCGMVGPKLGPLSPIPSTYNFHWTQLFTSLLTDSVRMSGLTINPCMKDKWCRAPHVQSFLYAISTDTLQILLSAGCIYDCEQDDKQAIITRYEVGMSETLLNQGYSIAVPFMNNWETGKPLVLDKKNSTNMETIFNEDGDLFCQDNIRIATSTMARSRLKELLGGDPEDHKLDILPWEYYVFFKVSRFVPHDILLEMNYDVDLLQQQGVSILSNKHT